MTEIGKSLVFYLKYFPEMQRMYEDREFPEIAQSPDRDTLWKKVDDVGNAAGTEVVSLFKACTNDWLTRLRAAHVAELSTPRWSPVERNWEVRFDVRSLSPDQPNGPTRQIGLNLEREGLIPWVWSRGGVAAEGWIRELLRSLSPGVETFGSKKHGWLGGSVCFAQIDLQWNAAEGFVVPAEPVIQQVRKTLEVISPAFITEFVRPR